MPTIVTHNSRFHVDDLFAVTTLIKKLEQENYERTDIVVKRTRDWDEINAADYVVDVGDEYDPARQRFDHHMTGGAKDHDAGFPYAAFGLVWDEYGEQLTGSAEAARMIKEKMVWPVDAIDNGVELYTPHYDGVYPYVIQNMARSFGPSWREEGERGYDDGFFEMLDIAGAVLTREIEQAQAIVEGKQKVVERYERADDKRIIELDAHYPYEYVLPAHEEPLYVVRPNVANGTYKIEAIQAKPYPFGFEQRKPFPEAWRGKRDEALEEVTGVEGAIFCHNAGFLVVTADRDSAWKIAQIAADA